MPVVQGGELLDRGVQKFGKASHTPALAALEAKLTGVSVLVGTIFLTLGR